MLRKLSVIVVGFMMVAGLAQASVGEKSDLQLSHRVAASVNQYAHFTIFDDVNAAVDNGVVTLTGKVTMPYKKGDIEKRVAKVDGVREVRNQMTVLPVSKIDDQLRQRIARAIYGNPNLRMYRAGANPSIHIVVENQHVTLTGVVNNDGDRIIARMAVEQFPALSVANNLKTTAELREADERPN
jgi:osmotically-inducible protein OsmY